MTYATWNTSSATNFLEIEPTQPKPTGKKENKKKTPLLLFSPHPTPACSPQLFYYKIKVEILLHIREYTLPIQSCSKNNLNSHTFRHHLAPVSIQADPTPRHKEGCPETERKNHSKTLRHQPRERQTPQQVTHPNCKFISLPQKKIIYI